MILDNMKLVYFVMRKYFPAYANDEDVKQVGMIGLIKAVDCYDKSKSKFSTLATSVIINDIRYYFRQHRKHLGVLSLNDKFDIGDNEYVEFEETLMGDEDVSLTPYCYEKFYNSLTEREKTIIDLIPYHKQEEISEIVGISQPQISRIRTKIKEKWRIFNGEDFN